MAELNTERLLLRPIVESDIDDIYEYCKNPNVGVHAGWKPHDDKEETARIMEEIFLNQESTWGIIRKEGGKLIGTIGLIEDPKRENDEIMMLGYAIGEPYWGRGLTTEAAKAVLEYGFLKMRLPLISCSCYPYNLRSRNVIEKCGFHYEGTLRMAARRFDGEVLDSACFSLTKTEYLEKQGAM